MIEPSQSSRSLVWIRWGAVAAPVVLIGIFTLANRFAGPAQANASESRNSEVEGPVAADSKNIAKIERWIADHKQPMSSPFEAAPQLERQAEPAAATNSPSAIKVTGVFRSHETTIAAINGKLFREGQEVRPGVSLKRVDVDDRKVVLLLSDGREVEVVSGKTAKLDW